MPGNVIFTKNELYQIGLLTRVGIDKIDIVDDDILDRIWEKVASVLDNEAIEEIDEKVQYHFYRMNYSNMDDNEVDPNIRRAVEMALDEGKYLRIRYYAHSSDETTERVIRPYEIDDDPNGPYLAAFCELRGEDRVFRLDAICEILEILSPTM
jgi:predicted DNA-binding transcriptional regulator YafY